MPDDPNVSVQTTQQTTEVVMPPGVEQISSTSKAVSSMFDKIAAGKAEGKTSREVVEENGGDLSHSKALPGSAKKPERKKEEKKVETKQVETNPTELEKKVEEKKEAPEEFSRDSLRQSTEAPKEEKKEEKKTDEEELPESELQVKPDDKPKTVKRIQALLNKVKVTEEREATTKKEAEAKTKKLAELEAELQKVKSVDPLTDERVKKQLDELAMYRRRYALDNDPDVKTKYDTRIEQSEKSIIDTLTSNRLGENLLREIQKEGGWNNFSKSGRPISISDGADGTKVVTMSEVADMILAALPPGERKFVEAAMIDQIQTSRDKERFIKEESDKAAEFFKKQEEERAKAEETAKKAGEEHRKFVDEWYRKTLESDWLRDKEVLDSMSDAEKADAEAYNKYNKQLRGLLEKSLRTGDLPGLMEIVGDSVRYYEERRTTASLRKQIDALKKEIETQKVEIAKVKRAGNSVPRQGSIATAVPASEKEQESKVPAGIGAAFDHIARHGKGSLSGVLLSDEE